MTEYRTFIKIQVPIGDDAIEGLVALKEKLDKALGDNWWIDEIEVKSEIARL